MNRLLAVALQDVVEHVMDLVAWKTIRDNVPFADDERCATITINMIVTWKSCA